MSKNPFSLYDFMGYLFPGIVSGICLYWLHCTWADMSQLTNVMIMKDAFLTSGMNLSLDKSLLFIVFSYIVGHIVSYLSSLTIEQFAVKVFDYPSVYLLRETPKVYKDMLIDYFQTDAYSTVSFMRWVKICLHFSLKILIFFAIFPVSFTIYSLGYLFNLNGWIVRPLDKYLIDTIRVKQYCLANKLQINHPDVNDNKCDYHRIIQHYVYLNMPLSQKRTDNYIALYGFLRCMSFIFSIVFVVVGIYALSTLNLDAEFDVDLCLLLVTLFFVSYVSFLGFMKFLRRHTLENYMTLLSGMYDENNPGHV